MIVAIIPARGGSRRLPRKNIRPFFRKPIIGYSIEAAKATKLFDKIFVSTDDPMTGVIAHQHGALPFLRPAHLARDEVGTQEVTAAALEPMTWARYCCCIYATAPLMRAEDIVLGFQLLLAKEAPFAYAVGPDGSHAGQFYWGRREAFLDHVSLEEPTVVKVEIPTERVCDINTIEDWERAEAMYHALHQGDPDYENRARTSMGR